MLRIFQKNSKKKEQMYSIQQRVFSIIMMATVACSIILSLFFLLVANHILMSREFVLIERSLDSTANGINHLLENADYVYDLLSSDRQLQSHLSVTYPDRKSQYTDELDVTSTLNAYKMYNNTLESVSLIGSNGLHSNSQSYSFKDTIDLDISWIENSNSVTRPKWFVVSENQVLVAVKDKPYITLAGPIRSLANGKLLGVLFLDVPEKRLEECISHSYESRTVLLDEQGNELLSLNREYAHVYQNNPVATKARSYDLKLLNSEKIRKTNGGYLFSTQLNNGWYIVDIVPNILSNSGIAMLLSAVFGAMILMIWFAYCFSRHLSIEITQRLVKMTHDMQRVESGDFSVVMDTDGNDEITILAKRFNSLLRYINVLINTLYKKQEELAEAELKTLQAQIKPHFLYNTLDTVVWMARFGRTKDVETIVLALTTYFRLGLNSGEDVISVSKELEHVKSYLTIQMYRYYQVFSYDIEIEDSLKTELSILQIPKLTLQPLVENAIYHGIKERSQNGYLRISIRCDKNDILISIADNGKGMDAETLDHLNHIRESNQSGYGLKNVDNRIRKMFGEQYGLSFESVPNRGTTVFLRIPAS